MSLFRCRLCENEVDCGHDLCGDCVERLRPQALASLDRPDHPPPMPKVPTGLFIRAGEGVESTNG